jgi:type I restriction enzyme M protein
MVQMIDAESWVGIKVDTKGDLYKGLLQKNAADTKSGAGQHFTPGALIQAMVVCIRAEPLKTIADSVKRFDYVLANPPFGKKTA